MSHSLIQVPHSLVLLDGFFTCYQVTKKTIMSKMSLYQLQLLVRTSVVYDKSSSVRHPKNFRFFLSNQKTTRAHRKLHVISSSPRLRHMLPGNFSHEVCALKQRTYRHSCPFPLPFFSALSSYSTRFSIILKTE